jgi:hypothetical protein
MSPLATRFEDFDLDEAYAVQTAQRGKNWDASSREKYARSARHRRNEGKAKLFGGAHLRRNSKRAAC